MERNGWRYDTRRKRWRKWSWFKGWSYMPTAALLLQLNYDRGVSRALHDGQWGYAWRDAVDDEAHQRMTT